MQQLASFPNSYYKTTDENDRNLCPRFGHCNILKVLYGKLSASLKYHHTLRVKIKASPFPQTCSMLAESIPP